MKVAVAYHEKGAQSWLHLDVPEDACVKDAIDRSGILGLYPHIDLSKQFVGVLGNPARLDTVLRAGDRVEIYRAVFKDLPEVFFSDSRFERERYKA